MTKTSEIDARFERAASFLPPRLVPRLSGTLIDSYWVDDQRYFFCVTEAGADGAVAATPKIVDARSGEITTVIARDDLLTLLASHRPALDAAALRDARYDMPDPARLVVTIETDAYHVDLAGQEVTRVETVGPGLALHSPDGRYAAFRRDYAIWMRDRETGAEWQLTPDGDRYHAYGAMQESALSPVSGREHPMPDGLWSADSEWFVTHRIDERHLQESALLQSVPVGGGRPVAHTFKVSTPQGELATAEFVAYHLPTGRAIGSGDRRIGVGVLLPFLAHQCWFAGESLYFLDWNRFFSEVSLVEMGLEGGTPRTVLTEKAEDGWLELHHRIDGRPMVRVLPGTGEVIWYSEADGRGHLYLHDLQTGVLKNPITQGHYVVRDILHVDEAKRRVLFLASGFADQDDPTRQRLCTANFDGDGFDTLLALDEDVFSVEGEVLGSADPLSGNPQLRPHRPYYTPSGACRSGTYVVLRTGAADAPTRMLLLDTDSGTRTELARGNIDEVWTAPRPRPFQVLAADGLTKLHGVMFVPSGFDPTGSYPLVDYIYPGPQLNWYMRRWPSWSGLDAQSVAELGTVAIVLETRGMPNRDRDFHRAGRGRLLEPQLSDHVAAIGQLAERHEFIDGRRVGIFGQSGGGYATARAMFDYPEVFRVGVSVCGNHDNRKYIAHWLDKYSGPPGSPERDDQSNVEVAHKLDGKLLLIHGEMDENVHPGNTLAVTQALIAAGKDFDQLIVPNAGHMVLLEEPYAYQRLWTYLTRHLIGAEPPAGFRLSWSPEGSAAAARLVARALA